MSVPLTVGGVTFPYPQQFEHNWGPTLTGWSTAVTNALHALPTTGVLTLSPSPTATINFANATNTGFLALTINGSNQLTFNGTPIGASTTLTDSHIFVGNISNQPADVAMTGDVTISDTGVTTLGALKVVNSQIAAAAAIAFTKLASTSPYFWYVANSAGVLSPIGVTASKVVITDANGLPSASAVTPTELSYVSGVTSSIQTQLGTFLPLSGGTLSGGLNMASNKITSLAAGTGSGDAVAFQQFAPITNIVFNSTSTLTVLTASFADVTNLTVTITPKSATSKVLVRFCIQTNITTTNGNRQAISMNLYGNSSLIAHYGEVVQIGGPSVNGDTYTSTVTLEQVDTPGSTSARVYKVQAGLARNTSNGTGAINDNTDDTPLSTVSAWEIPQ